MLFEDIVIRENGIDVDEEWFNSLRQAGVDLTNSVSGAISYQGAWDADANTPTLASGVGTTGYYYVVSVAGSTDLDGITDWKPNDWAVFNGTAWEKVDNSDLVSSVNGEVGVVILDTEDINEGAGLTRKYTLKHNLAATTDPAITDDSATLYSVGSLWINHTNKTIFTCTDNTASAAVWVDAIGLENVTNDAQLKREANDFSTFDEKLVPVDDDIVLIEDSEDSGNKKKLRLQNMIGGGSGEGSFNYVPTDDANLENGIGSWESNTPTTFDVVLDTTSKLRGENCLRIDRLSTLVLGGSMVSNAAFPINVDLDGASMTTASFEGDFTAANYEDGNISLKIRDLDNGVFLNGEYEIPARAGQFTYDFQTSSDGTQYEMWFVPNGSSVGTYSVYVDTLSFAPQKAKVYGTPSVDGKPFTPTGTWTGSTSYSGIYSKVGDKATNIEISVNLSGAPTPTATLDIDISGIGNIDLDKISSGGSGVEIPVGTVRILEAGVRWHVGQIVLKTATTLRITYQENPSGTIVSQGNLTNTAPITFASGDSIQITIPNLYIKGWSSQVVLSETTQNREVFSSYKIASGVSSSLTQPIDYATKIEDKTNAVTVGSGWRADIQEDGLYKIEVGFLASTAADIYLYVSDVRYERAIGTSAAGLGLNGSITLSLEKGQYVDVRTSVATTLSNDSRFNNVSITKLNTGSQTIAATESIYVDGAGNGGETIAVGDGIPFITVDDSHGAWDGDSFTAPTDGRYQVEGMARFDTTNLGRYIALNVNGTNIKAMTYGHSSAITPFSGEITLSKDDVLELRTNTGGLMVNSTLFHHISITRFK